MVDSTDVKTEFNFNRPSIFVGNLDVNVTENLLYHFFSLISKKVYCRIQRDNCGKSRGFAFVNYIKREDAEKALKKLNYSIILGKPIRLTWKVKDVSKIMNEKAKVFVKYLPKYVTELGLSKMAEHFGETISVRISRRLDGVSNGYGYVQFAKIESADKFIKGVNGQEIGGLFLLAEPFKPKEIKRNSTYSCFVENLSPIVSDKQITELFSPYGKVNSTHVLKNTEGKCLSLTCVNFDSASNTTSTLSNLNNVSVDGSCLYVDQHLPKEEKQHRLEQLNFPVFPTSVIVRNLGNTITSTKLASVFSNYGTVKNIEMLKALGLAKVEFSSHAEAHRALRLNGTSLGETKMVVTSESDEIVSSTSSFLTSSDPNETSNQNSKSETFPRFERFTSFEQYSTFHEDSRSMKNEDATSQGDCNSEGVLSKKFLHDFPT